MTKDDVIRRLCWLVTRVESAALKDEYTHDCFCGEYGFAVMHGYVVHGCTVEEPVLEWMEAAVEEKLARPETEAPYKLYVWRRQPSYVVVAHAQTVARARELAFEDNMGFSSDGSCPEREAACRAVKTTQPEIHYRACAEFVLTDSALLREAEAENDELKVLLERSLRLLPFGEGANLVKEARKHGVKV